MRGLGDNFSLFRKFSGKNSNNTVKKGNMVASSFVQILQISHYFFADSNRVLLCKIFEQKKPTIVNEQGQEHEFGHCWGWVTYFFPFLVASTSTPIHPTKSGGEPECFIRPVRPILIAVSRDQLNAIISFLSFNELSS